MNKNKFDPVSIKVLTEEKIKKIDEATLIILEKTGVKVLDKEAKDLLHGLGCNIEKDDIVKIPPSVVKNALKSVPNKVDIYDREGNLSMELENKNIYFAGCGNLIKYLDPYTSKSIPLTREHTETLTKVLDYLPNIDFVVTAPMMKDPNIPEKYIGRMAYSTILQNTTKPLNYTVDDIDSSDDIIELSAIVAGSHEKLKEKPFTFIYCQPISPLLHSEDSCRKLIHCARAGVPVVYMPYCMMGGTSPMAYAGTLAQCFAEVLSGLVIHQAASQGASFIAGTMPSTIDMKTTIGTYGSPEFHLNVAASSEISHYYGLPFYGTGGCTDSKSLDYQTVMESTMNNLTSVLSYANMVHDIGYMDHGNTNSPELIVLTNEIIDMLKVIKRGIEVNDETLCLDIIEEIGPGGHYLNHFHTLDNFRQVWYSDLLDHSMEGEMEPLNKKIKDKTINIIENHKPKLLPNDTVKLIKEMETKWLKHI